MARAESIEQDGPFGEEMTIMAFPMQTLKRLTAIAAAEGKTVAQVFDEAISEYLARKKR